MFEALSNAHRREIIYLLGLQPYSIHHLAPELFGGYDDSEEGVFLATPEKALFDTVYLRAPRGGQVLLPELELPDRFQEKKLKEWINRIARPRLRTLVSRGLDKALAGAVRGRATPSSPFADT